MTDEMRGWAETNEREKREAERENDEIGEYLAAAYQRGYANAMRDLMTRFGDD